MSKSNQLMKGGVMGDIQGIVKKAKGEVDKVLADPRNKNAVLASTIAYCISKDNKERNAIIAGILAYTFLDGGNKDEDVEEDE